MKHERFLIEPGQKVKLKKFDTAYTGDFRDEDDAGDDLKKDVQRLAELQDVLYAQDTYALLVVFQAMDAAGKDGAIKHVMSGVNPQGCQVMSFKAPTAIELDHDYLWRASYRLPERGRIGIFNRSYYEEVLVVRVHPELLEHQKLPPEGRRKPWKHRFEDINHYERYLVRNGIVIVKFFLHVSKAEQKRRFLERIDDLEKNWKFSDADVRERAHWDAYMEAYEEMLEQTSTDWAPWYVIPADHKWFTRAAVADVIVKHLERLDLKYPVVDDARRRQMLACRETLLHEDD